MEGNVVPPPPPDQRYVNIRSSDEQSGSSETDSRHSGDRTDSQPGKWLFTTC